MLALRNALAKSDEQAAELSRLQCHVQQLEADAPLAPERATARPGCAEAAEGEQEEEAAAAEEEEEVFETLQAPAAAAPAAPAAAAPSAPSAAPAPTAAARPAHQWSDEEKANPNPNPNPKRQWSEEEKARWQREEAEEKAPPY